MQTRSDIRGWFIALDAQQALLRFGPAAYERQMWQRLRSALRLRGRQGTGLHLLLAAVYHNIRTAGCLGNQPRFRRAPLAEDHIGHILCMNRAYAPLP